MAYNISLLGIHFSDVPIWIQGVFCGFMHITDSKLSTLVIFFYDDHESGELIVKGF